MNQKLITQAEKNAALRQRSRRNAARKWSDRRIRLLEELAFAGVGDVANLEPLLEAQDATEILFSHLRRARNVSMHLKRKLLLARLSPSTCPIPQPLCDFPPPTRILRGINRSWVFPPLVGLGHGQERGLNLVDALVAAKREQSALTPHGLLVFFATACGLPLSASADLLAKHALIPAGFTSIELGAIQAAKDFWDYYSEAQKLHGLLAATGELSAATGDWAFFDHKGIERLLPGVCIPRPLRRLEYATNLISAAAILRLDVYAAPSMTPLFQHPL